MHDTTLSVARPPRRRAVPVRRWAVCGALGLATTVAVAWVSALWVDPQLGASTSASAHTAYGLWTVTAYRRAGACYIHSLREWGVNWSVEQATGAPDTPAMGDNVTAWASATPDGQEEWLTLDYDRAVVPKALRVYESYCPGALFKVGAFKDENGGEEVQAWAGKDPYQPDARGIAVAEVPLDVPFKTRRVKIYLDSVHVPGWNEIDAVGLVDQAGNVQWASSASASSTYGSAAAPAGTGALESVRAITPDWSGLGAPGEAVRRRQVKREERAVEAHGWPMPALWCERDFTPVALPTTGPALSPGVGSSSTVSDLTIDYLPAGPGTLVRSSGATGFGSSTYFGSPPVAVPVRVTGGLPVAPTFAPGTSAGPAALPYRPIVGGLLVDTLVYGALFALLYRALAAPRRLVREVSRLRRGQCIACGYDLGYDFVPGCPECGWRRTAERGRSR